MAKRHLVNLSLVGGLALGAVLAGPANPAAAKTGVAAKSGASAAHWRPAPVRTSFTVDGTVAGVDGDAATITVDKLGKGGLTTSATVAVSGSAVVTINGITATLPDVPTGARVRVSGTTTSGVSTATKVQATTTWSFQFDSTVAAVDTDNSTITGTGYDPIAVDGEAVITVDGVTATLADVPAGARVRISGTVTNSVPAANRIQATTTWSFKFDGTVAAVDTDNSTITGTGHDAVAVDSAAVITVDGVTATLADVPAGARVRVSGTVTNSVPLATRIQVTTRWSFRVDGTVKAVDATAGTITVSWYSPIPVSGSAYITLNRSAVPLAGLPTGARVRVSGTVTNGTPAASRIEATAPVNVWSRYAR